MALIWRTFDDPAALNDVAAVFVLSCAAASIARRRTFRLVLAGGRTPGVLYASLRTAEADWSRWHVYFTDERCVGPDDPERNSRMARECLLDHVPIPATQIHDIPTELGADAAAIRYGAQVMADTPFDLVILGVGEDGHTASLFPDRAIDRDAWAIAVSAAPKPPLLRVSLGLRALRATADVLVVASGADKQRAVDSWRHGAPLPITVVTVGLRGMVLLDRAAGGASSSR